MLDPATGDLSPRTEALLYAADKAEHVDTLVLPALRRGEVVITDRYVDSSIAYQGAGRVLELDDVTRLQRWATGDLRPHLTVVLDVDPEHGLGRFDGRDRIEAEGHDFHERARQAFLDARRRRPRPLPRGRRPPAGRRDRRAVRDRVAAAARAGRR